MEHLLKAIQGIDWAMLRQQKNQLLTAMEFPCIAPTQRDAIQGIVNLLDAIQDASVDDGMAAKTEVFDYCREFTIQISEGGYTHTAQATLSELRDPAEECFEFMYALNDRIGEIEKMTTGESISFQPNRDDYNSKGIITRTE